MKKENWKHKCVADKITAVGYGNGTWFNLGSSLNSGASPFDNIDPPENEPEIIIANIIESEKTVEETKENNSYTASKRILIYVLLDQHDNVIYEFPAHLCFVSYSPLMGSYKDKEE